MKMITRDSDLQYLKVLQERLEEAGIPAIIQGDNTARMIIPFFLLQPTLWIYFDEQFEDAVNLTMDSEYIVTTGVDVEAFYEKQPTELEQRSQLNAALIHLALFLLLIMAGMFIFTKVLNGLST